jgi:hypothetical protein
VDGRVRLVEGLALPDERIEFQLSYYNSARPTGSTSIACCRLSP